jgi:YcxB-like protein
MNISFENKFKDIFAFNLYTLMRSPLVLVSILVIFVMLGWPIASPLLSKLAQETDVIRIIVGVMILLLFELVLLCAILAFWILLTLLSIMSKKNKTFLTQRTIILGEDTILSESEYARAEVKWMAIQKIGRTNSYLYLYTGNNAAMVIPRRAFPNVEQWNAFHEFCTHRTKHLS